MVMELGGVPAGDALTRLLTDLPKTDAGLPVMLGVGEAPRARDEWEVTNDEAAAARKRARVPERTGRLRGRVVDVGEEHRVGDETKKDESMRAKKDKSANARTFGTLRRVFVVGGGARGGVVRRGRTDACAAAS